MPQGMQELGWVYCSSPEGWGSSLLSLFLSEGGLGSESHHPWKPTALGHQTTYVGIGTPHQLCHPRLCCQYHLLLPAGPHLPVESWEYTYSTQHISIDEILPVTSASDSPEPFWPSLSGL